MDCFTSMFPRMKCAIQPQPFEPYASAVLDKCLKMASLQLELYQISLSVGAKQQPQREFHQESLIMALDLISSLVESLEGAIEPRLASGPLLGILLQCCRAEVSSIRQSAFALTGDLAKSCPSLLQPVTAELTSLALLHLDPQVMTPVS
jgi:transportin-1